MSEAKTSRIILIPSHPAFLECHEWKCNFYQLSSSGFPPTSNFTTDFPAQTFSFWLNILKLRFFLSNNSQQSFPNPKTGSSSAAANAPITNPSSMDLDSLMKVASQFEDLKDPQFLSCFQGWESNPSQVSFELISGHFLIDTPYRVTDNLTPSECLLECRNDPDCKSVNVDYKGGTCEYLSTRLRNSLSKSMRPSLGQNHFEKVCQVRESIERLCSGRDWTFERVRSSSLRGFEKKQHNKVLLSLPDILSRESCQVQCMNYSLFPCRSCEFNYRTRECFLSPFNRFSSNDPGVMLITTPDVDYFESNCIPGEFFLHLDNILKCLDGRNNDGLPPFHQTNMTTEAKGFCNTKGIKDQKQLLTEKLLLTKTLSECQTNCMTSTSVGFTCRSLTYDSSSSTCALSHHSSKSAPSSMVSSKEGNHIYFEVANCFEGKFLLFDKESKEGLERNIRCV